MLGIKLDASAGACLVRIGLVVGYKRQGNRGSGIVSHKSRLVHILAENQA